MFSGVNRRRILFFGNDAFSVAHLEALLRHAGAATSALSVTTTSARTPVFHFARAHRLRTLLWRDLSPRELPAFDLGVLASFGHLLPSWLLAGLPVLNVHPSLLPRWRGSAPVVHAVLRGDATTGVSVILLRPHRFDCGPLLAQEAMPTPDGVTALALTEALALRGRSLLLRVLEDLPAALEGQRPQAEVGASVARRIRPSDAVLDWQGMSGDQVDRLARSVGDLMPLASRFGDLPVRLRDFASPAEVGRLRADVCLPPDLPPGSPVFEKRLKEVVFVKCAGQEDWTAVRSVRIGRGSTGQRWLSALEFHNGYLSKEAFRGAVFASERNPLFRRRPEVAPRSAESDL